MKKVNYVINNSDFNVVTHGGAFHADEVAATVLLAWALNKEELKIARVFKVDENHQQSIVYDVGGGEFDHHFKPLKAREDGRLYSSVGLVWKHYKKDIVANILNSKPELADDYREVVLKEVEKEDDYFDRKIIYPIDASDTGTSDTVELLSPITQVVRTLGYIEDKNEGFLEAVRLTEQLLLHLFNGAFEKLKLQNVFDKAFDDSFHEEKYTVRRVLFLEKFIPWKEYLFTSGRDKDIDFVLYPSLRGGYMADAVADGPMSFNNKVPFPEAFRGKSGGELQEVTGISDSIFCHATGFCFSAESINSVLQAIDIAIKENQ